VFTNRLGISVYPEHEHVELPDGPVSGQAVFRHERSADRGILKLKGNLGWAIYNGMTQPVGTKCEWLFPNKCKHMGVNVVASTQNWIDPVVCEMRFSPTGELLSMTDDYSLYQSLAMNRQIGQATFDGERLTLTGDAALGLQEFVNAGRRVSAESVLPQGPVVLRIVDMESGHWEIEAL
jgi:hypothetical protein